MANSGIGNAKVEGSSAFQLELIYLSPDLQLPVRDFWGRVPVECSPRLHSSTRNHSCVFTIGGRDGNDAATPVLKNERPGREHRCESSGGSETLSGSNADLAVPSTLLSNVRVGNARPRG
jgi:hypothetical protein